MTNTNFKNKYSVEIESDFKTSENFNDLLNDIEHKVEENTITKGEIIAVDSNVVVVDIGTKNEGYIPISEFKDNNEEVKIGKVIDVYVEKIESRNGNTIISRDKALKEEYWLVLESALKNSTHVEGIIFGKVKGGFTVDIHGIVAFLPGSQVDVRPVKDISPLMGIKQPFRILKIDRKQGNIVVSRRAVLEETRDEHREEALASIEEGQVLEGVVKNITDYGAFIDLGSVDGLLHVTDVSWGRINHPSEILTLGQKVDVKVIKFDKNTKRISLGMKQLEENPWEDIAKRFPKGQIFKGKITNITDYGVFIELEPGIEGLVHVSEIAWGKSNVHPKKLVNQGDEVNFMVLDIDSNKHRISLGMKQCNDNPWQKFANTHQVGDEVEGFVKNVVDFGIFLGFEGDIDGLVHISDIDWDEQKGLEKLKTLKKDDKVKAKVLLIDVEKERIGLGIKQLEQDPLATLLEKYKKGDVITCTVKTIQDDGIETEVEENITGFIKKADLSSERGEQRTSRFATGERCDAKIMSIDKNNRKLGLSIKALEIEEKKKAIEEYGSTDSGASLGDILGDALNQIEHSKKSTTDKKKEAK